MRTSIVVAVVGVLALAAGGGYYRLEVYPQQRFRAGLDQTLATLPPGTTARYKDAHYSIPSGEAVVSGLTVHAAIPGDAPGQIDVTIESIHLVRPNLDFSRAWATAAANTSGLTPETALPVADSVTLKGGQSAPARSRSPGNRFMSVSRGSISGRFCTTACHLGRNSRPRWRQRRERQTWRLCGRSCGPRPGR